jgi:hypothetical protein
LYPLTQVNSFERSREKSVGNNQLLAAPSVSGNTKSKKALRRALGKFKYEQKPWL